MRVPVTGRQLRLLTRRQQWHTSSTSTSTSTASTILSRTYYDSSSPPDELLDSDNDFILSILQASPSMRDSRSYLSSFTEPSPEDQPITPVPGGTESPNLPVFTVLPDPIAPLSTSASTSTSSSSSSSAKPPLNPLVTSLLNPTVRRAALVKVQGPFTDVQLDSVAKGMSRLQKLGLVSVIVVDRDDIPSSEPTDSIAAQRQRTLMLRDVERMVHFLNRHRAPARPILATVTRQGDPNTNGENTISSSPGGEVVGNGKEVFVEEEGLDHVRRAVQEGEIPVLLPVALDTECRARRVGANAVLAALAKAMSKRSKSRSTSSTPASSNGGNARASKQIDLTPMRLLVINREGGIPSYARSGMPHLSINLASEYQYINDTFNPMWRSSHPTALGNLALAQACLQHMPREASALVVSHRSPAAMIGNLITNKPAHSASLPHSLLSQSEGRITRDTPTLIRKGSPVRVLRSMDEVDRDKLSELLERSFKRKLNKERYFARLEKDLDFVIVIGDYVGAAVCTLEGASGEDAAGSGDGDGHGEPICYLDKFAVLPQHQGDGTVDFLWVALRDETYGLGLLDAANPSEGSLSGKGRGRDLVWRSRGDNPVNKWYHERSSGFLYLPTEEEKVAQHEAAAAAATAVVAGVEGTAEEVQQSKEHGTTRTSSSSATTEKAHAPSTTGGADVTASPPRKGWKMFWCDAEQRLREKAREQGREFGGGRLVKVVEDEERGRLERWAPVIAGIKSAWK